MKNFRFIQIMALVIVFVFTLCACDSFMFSDKTDVTNETTNKATTTVSSKPVETTANCEPTTTETVVTETVSEDDELEVMRALFYVDLYTNEVIAGREMAD